MSSRRGILKTGLLLGGSALVGGEVLYIKTKPVLEIAEQLVYFLDYPEVALSVGQGLLDTDPASHAISADQMINNLLEGLEVSREQLHGMTNTEMLERLHKRVHSDFEKERVVLDKGWVLSRTEAQLCALRALLVT